MSTYLEKFRSSLPTIQGRQILNLLQQKKDSGEIKSVQEFKNKLTELTAALVNSTIAPTLKLFPGEANQVIDSTSYNFMSSRIKDDLETAFNELETIDEVLTAHNQIINQVVLKSLHTAINEIENQVSLLEFINRNDLGLTHGQFNTFSASTSPSTNRGDDLGTILYKGTVSGSEAVIDTIGERLTLGYDDNQLAIVQSATQLFDATTPASEIDVTFPESSISNIIDNQKNTFWIYNTLLSQPKVDGVLHKIRIDLAAVQDLNFIELEPACPYPLVITNISYEGSDGILHSIGGTPLTVSKPTRIDFSRISAAALVFEVTQNNYIESQFEERDIDNNFGNAVAGNPPSSIDLSSVSSYLRDILSSDYQLEGIFGVPRLPSEKPKHKYYEYLIGFDNIRTGLSSYQDQSIFVSPVLTVEKPGLIGVKATENTPALTSIEYEIVKENINSEGKFINIDRFPILPVGQGSIVQERLDLINAVSSNVNNAGLLRFYPDLTQSVTVYRNGTALAFTTDWVWEASLEQTLSTSQAPMVKAIKILVPLSSDIYTVSYTPKLGNSIELGTSSLIELVNLGSASHKRLIRNNIVVTDRNVDDYQIAKSNIYLIIVLRRNSPDESITPAVEEYMLLAGNQDSSKYSSI